MKAAATTVIMLLIATMLKHGPNVLCERVPCVDNCDSLRRPVCAVDSRRGARYFDNYCLMDAHNLCYNSDYKVQSDLGECLWMYDEEYSRESKVPFKNPIIKQLYDNTIDRLYL